MSSPPAMSGVIPPEGPVALLRAIERRATTGALRFTEPSGRVGEVALARGLVSEGDAASRAALERFLALTGGSYEVHQQLPALPVSRGDEDARVGRLGVHGVLDLLQYCDRAGLTGALYVTSDDRHADFLYDAGELTAVRVFGEEHGDVQHVLAWEDGAFRIEAWSELPALPAPGAAREPSPAEVGGVRANPETEELLKVVEVTLSSLLDERSPEAPVPLPSAGAETRAPRSDATVRVIYLGAPGTARRMKTPPPHPRAAGPAVAPPALARPEPARAAEPGPTERSPARVAPPPEPARRRSDPTLETLEPPVEPARAVDRRKTTVSFVREAGPVATLALVLSALLFLAAIAHPLVLE